MGTSGMIIVDTDILIDAARGVGDAVRCLEQIEQNSEPCISVITHMEMIAGCRNKKELRLLDGFLKRFQEIPLDEEISDEALNLVQTYRLSHGLMIPDAIIAATAIVSDIRLATKNQKDYRFITNLRLLPYPQPFSEPVK